MGGEKYDQPFGVQCGGLTDYHYRTTVFLLAG